MLIIYVYAQSQHLDGHMRSSVTHASDELKAGLFITRVGTVTILWRAVIEGRLWGSDRSPEEVSHFGEPSKRGGVRVLNEPLRVQPSDATFMFLALENHS